MCRADEHSNCVFIGDFTSRTRTPPDHVNISDKCVELR